MSSAWITYSSVSSGESGTHKKPRSWYKQIVLRIVCGVAVELTDVIDRARELHDLQQAWEAAQRAEPQLVVLWGRRRVGKTFLLTHFAAEKRHVYFTGTRQDSERRQVDRYAMCL